MRVPNRFSFVSSEQFWLLPLVTRLIFSLDYVHDGYQLPPIGDPHNFLRFAQTHFGGDRPECWQAEEFAGDKVWASAVALTLKDWPLYGPIQKMCFLALVSNHYQRRLALKFRLLDFCIGIKGQDISQSFSGIKGPADVFEVHLFSSL